MLFAPPRWRLTFKSAGAATLIGFQGRAIEIPSPDVEELREALLLLTDKATQQYLILDLGNVAYLTSDLIEVLLELYHRLRSHGGRLSVCRPTPAVAEIFSTLRLNTLMNVRPHLPDSQTWVQW